MVVADATSTARTMWTLFEPVHAVTYFTADSRSAYEQAGLRGFWRGYFAGRAAPLGPVSAAVVAASFFNFAPAFVARAIPGVWELITPEQALRARQQGAVGALRGLLAGREAEAASAADLLWRVVGELDFPGRMLSAANAALPVLGDGLDGGLNGGPDGGPNGGLDGGPGGGLDGGLARLWQAATVLREHRGDGHFAALAAADIDGCEAVALRCLMDMRRENLQPVRGWTDEEWDDALARLAARGWVDGDGPVGGADGYGEAGALTLTSAGREAHAAVENATDRAAARPWAKLGPEVTAEIAAALSPLSQACATVLPFPSPIGLPAPRAAG
jgi:helix-turn-helix protein